MKLNHATILLILFSIQSYAQIIVDREDIWIDTHYMNEVGKELFIKKNDTTLLASNKYLCNYTKRDKTYPISFFINHDGKPHGIVESEGRFKTYVNNGIIYKFEKYRKDSPQLVEEIFMRGDTIIGKNYNRHGQMRTEYWILNKKTIYHYGCNYHSETDSLLDCTLDDDIKGLYIIYRDGGKIASKSVTKNLPKGIRKQTEEYNEKGELTEKKIEYENGKTKTIYANGSYELITMTEKEEFIEEYTKAGKLIRKYKVEKTLVEDVKPIQNN